MELSISVCELRQSYMNKIFQEDFNICKFVRLHDWTEIQLCGL